MCGFWNNNNLEVQGVVGMKTISVPITEWIELATGTIVSRVELPFSSGIDEVVIIRDDKLILWGRILFMQKYAPLISNE